jgi:hypothetical protein
MPEQRRVSDADRAVNRFLAVSRWIAVLAFAGVGASLATEARWRGVRCVDLFWQGIVPLVPLTLLFASSQRRRSFSLAKSHVDLIVIALALNLYYAAGSTRFSTVLSQIAGWRAGQSIIRAGILGSVLVVSLVWLRRAWRRSAPPWARW